MPFITIALFVILILPRAAFGEIHRYSIYDIPEHLSGEQCREFGRQLSETFAAATGAKVTGVFCERRDPMYSYTVRIGYEANEYIPVVSTYVFAATYEKRGLFQSQDECRQQLQTYIEDFESETRLDAKIAFCAKEDLRRDRPWYPYIDGFGDANRIPDRVAWHSSRPYHLDINHLEHRFETVLADRRATFKAAISRSSATMGGITVFFYRDSGGERIRLSSNVVASVPGLESCQEEAARLEAALLSIGKISTIAAYCSSPYSNPSTFELQFSHLGFLTLDLLRSAETFDSMAECRAAIPEIENNLNGVYGDKLQATVCGLPRFSGTRRNPQYHVIGVLTFR